MKPPGKPCSDHSYELPLRRNLLLLLDLLGLLRFIVAVLLDRLGVVPCQSGGSELPQLPGQLTWGADDAAMERFLEATPWASGSPATTTGTTRSRTAAVPYRRRRPADGEHGGAEGDAAVCTICLAALEAGGGHQQEVAELGVCSHAFHAACIDAWACSSGGEGEAATTTCPLCRAPMLPTAWEGRRAELVPRSPQ
ncbi:hypothetical protein HU200_063204 [Digitaria exilis]|uniref:RING-type domain-containing protein n=1 Tax=Digitaria exilis TaxID=1010633 RepID=A0A835A652_9POAL|nr:hypothetical protein HU200_063204 [Digitaria exilis]